MQGFFSSIYLADIKGFDFVKKKKIEKTKKEIKKMKRKIDLWLTVVSNILQKVCDNYVYLNHSSKRCVVKPSRNVIPLTIMRTDSLGHLLW